MVNDTFESKKEHKSLMRGDAGMNEDLTAVTNERKSPRGPQIEICYLLESVVLIDFVVVALRSPPVCVCNSSTPRVSLFFFCLFFLSFFCLLLCCLWFSFPLFFYGLADYIVLLDVLVYFSFSRSSFALFFFSLENFVPVTFLLCTSIM